MNDNLNPDKLSKEELSDCLSKFVQGVASKRGSSARREVIQSALTLLQVVPATRDAVLQYIGGVYDEAVDEHFSRLGKSDQPMEINDGNECSAMIEDIQTVFLKVIHIRPSAWAPIMSSWCLECLGDISSKYSERRALPHTSSLNELLLVWMSCPATRSLIQITSECFASISEADAGPSVDALIETSVTHSPHFDWIVAHIGSCYPQTIINRVLLSGLDDFCVHCQADGSASTSDAKQPKMASVIGVLSHLASHHGDCLRSALWMVLKTSLNDNASAMQLSAPVYFLHLASASGPLLQAVIDVFLQHVTVDVVNKLTAQLSTRTPPCIRDPKNLIYQVVHLLMSCDHNTIDVVQVLLTYTGHTSSQSADAPAKVASVNPVIQESTATILNFLLLELQRVSNSRCSDPLCELTFLRSLQSRSVTVQLCRALLTTTHAPSRLWLFRLLSCIALHCGEACAVNILSEIIQHANDSSLMNVFVQIEQDIEAKYPDILKLTTNHAVHSLVQSIGGPSKDSDDQLLLTNLVLLCRWQTSPGKSSPTRASIIEALSSQVDIIANCLASSRCKTADVLELLSMLDIPSRLDLASLIRLSSRIVRCFFTALRDHETNTKFCTSQRCIDYLGRLSTCNSATQACILRLLLEGALSEELCPLFGGKVADKTTTVSTFYKVETSDQNMMSENRSLMAAGTQRLMFHSGVIGQGLKNGAVSHNHTAVDDLRCMPDVIHSRQLLLEALWACSCRRSMSRDVRGAATRAIVDDTERKLTAEVAKHLAQMLVELVCPDVLYNDIPWPELDSVHVTIEHDLQVWRCFDENPVLWDVMDFLSSGVGAMKYCSCLLRSCTATLINQWESSREKTSKSHPKLLNTTFHVIEFMRKGQLLPEPLCYIGDILKHVSPYEVYLLLINIWNYIKENAPLPGTRLMPGCGSRYTDLIHSIIHNNIGELGHLCVLFFPPTSATNTSTPIIIS